MDRVELIRLDDVPAHRVADPGPAAVVHLGGDDPVAEPARASRASASRGRGRAVRAPAPRGSGRRSAAGACGRPCADGRARPLAAWRIPSSSRRAAPSSSSPVADSLRVAASTRPVRIHADLHRLELAEGVLGRQPAGQRGQQLAGRPSVAARLRPEKEADVAGGQLLGCELGQQPRAQAAGVEGVLDVVVLGAHQPDEHDQRVAQRAAGRAHAALSGHLVAESPVAQLQGRQPLERERLQLADPRQPIGRGRRRCRCRRLSLHRYQGSHPGPAGAVIPLAGRSGVELFDLRGVLLGDRLALQLHRRRQLVAARLPLLGQDRELLDLLDARHLLRCPPRRPPATASLTCSSLARSASESPSIPCAFAQPGA